MADQSTPIVRIKPSVSLGWYIGVLLAILIAIIVAACVDICIHNTQFDKNKALLFSAASTQSSNPLKNLPVDSTKTHIINDEDLQRFNAHIEYLSEKVDSEVKRTQENSQYDIDRLNTFLALGIGLLAIIGGLLPIFVNFFSKETLVKQMEVFEKTCDGLSETAKSAKENAMKAKGDAENANQIAAKASQEIKDTNEKITAVNSSYDTLSTQLAPLEEQVSKIKEATKKMPYIDMLILQNVVAKIMTTDALKLNTGNSRAMWVESYINNLAKSIESFSKDGVHSIENYEEDHLKDFFVIISELQTALRSGPIRVIPGSRSFQPKIEEVILGLNKLDKDNKEKCKMELKEVAKLLIELKELVSQKAETIT